MCVSRVAVVAVCVPMAMAVPMIMTVRMSMSMSMIVPVPMSMIIFRRFFGEFSEASEGSVELCGTAQEGNAGEHRDIQEFTSVVADRQAQQKVSATFRGGNGAPDEDCCQHQQQHAKVSTATEDREGFRPVHREAPEGDPRQQWQPGHSHVDQAEQHLEEGLQQLQNTGDQLQKGVH